MHISFQFSVLHLYRSNLQFRLLPPNHLKQDGDGRGKAHEVECSEDAKVPCEVSPANYATSKVSIRAKSCISMEAVIVSSFP